MINIFNYLLIFNIFAGAFVLFRSPFEFYLGYIFIIAFLIIYIFKYRKFDINVSFLAILSILTFFSVLNSFLGNGSIFFVIKQVFGIFITGSAYYLLIKANNYKIDKLFRIYLRIAFVVAVIGIIQECSFMVGFKYGYDYSWLMQKWKYIPTSSGVMLRVNSIFMESSHFAITMAPALFVSLLNIIKKDSPFSNLKLNKLSSSIVIISYVLTFSIIAYIAIIISLIFVIFNIKKYRKPMYLLLFLAVFFVFIFASYSFVSEISTRINNFFDVISGAQPIASHGTIYAYLSNGFVAFKSFLGNPFFGSGLGSHPISYDKFMAFDVAQVFWKEHYIGLNKADANCLFLRLVSETGLFGVLVVLYFLFKHFIKVSDNKNLLLISNSIFVLFILQLIRQGHYFYNGLFFFVWMYYFAYKINNMSKLEILNTESY